jgi:hypothetical protein
MCVVTKDKIGAASFTLVASSLIILEVVSNVTIKE